ncbi:MAG TPA: hypothetical protein VK638_17235, partial [Edaphobacter sp.]|nr:hypothetical protein [Edaphobacter sp.]
MLVEHVIDIGSLGLQGGRHGAHDHLLGGLTNLQLGIGTHVGVNLKHDVLLSEGLKTAAGGFYNVTHIIAG